jgi:hypothetical protein
VEASLIVDASPLCLRNFSNSSYLYASSSVKDDSTEFLVLSIALVVFRLLALLIFEVSIALKKESEALSIATPVMDAPRLLSVGFMLIM